MTSFVLKIIAAVSMLLDHTGLLLFPESSVFRILGRLAFPLYAYCIAEGFRYTRNRLRYFLQIFLLGTVCQIVYTITSRDLYIGILLTFSLSILILFFLEGVKKTLAGEKSPLALFLEKHGRTLSPHADRTLSMFLLCAVIIAVFALCVFVRVDYGFFGVMLPVFTNMFDDRGRRFVLFSACLLALCIDLTAVFPIQYWSLLAIPLIAMYNGQPGRIRLKYFFYIFYPAHLVLLEGIAMLLSRRSV